jgi:hypothetical protein
MYWLRKLTVSRMTGTDVTVHLNDMAKIFKRLSSLVSNERPLTIDDIYSTDERNWSSRHEAVECIGKDESLFHERKKKQRERKENAYLEQQTRSG